MVKNVKIDDAVHRRLSIKAAEMNTQKGELCTALIAAGLDHLPEELIKEYAKIVTSHEPLQEHFGTKKSRPKS